MYVLGAQYNQLIATVILSIPDTFQLEKTNKQTNKQTNMITHSLIFWAYII